MSICFYYLYKDTLRFFLRGVSFDKESYLNQLNTVEHIIIDMSSLVDAFEQQDVK